MSPENDQTRWVGVRPVNPAEDLYTATQKRLPAIADMQAVTAMVREYDSNNTGAHPWDLDIYTVPADSILMLTMAYATYINVTCTGIVAYIRADMNGGVNFPFASWPHTAIFEPHLWFGMLPVDEGEIIRFQWGGGAGGALYIAAIMGYLVGKYT